VPISANQWLKLPTCSFLFRALRLTQKSDLQPPTEKWPHKAQKAQKGNPLLRPYSFEPSEPFVAISVSGVGFQVAQPSPQPFLVWCPADNPNNFLGEFSSHSERSEESSERLAGTMHLKPRITRMDTDYSEIGPTTETDIIKDRSVRLVQFRVLPLMPLSVLICVISG
jgi:hypothetical protein